MRVIRNYRLGEVIGNGSTGTVYKAIQTALDRTVALKEMHGHLARDADFIRRFEREAKTAATLQHENILSVFDFGQEGESYFIALEYVDGEDLKAVLAREAKMAPAVAIAIALGVLRGLEHAHRRGIVHRDMKPANVMLTREGTPKVADFSIAQASQLPSMTVTGAILGTPAYMSPEQVGGRPLDARTDLFSLGVILFEMLAGYRPFEGDSYPTVISQLLTFHPPQLHELDPLIPPEVSAVVTRALEKDVSRRIGSATDFHDALERAAQAAKIPVGRSLVAEYLQDPKAFGIASRARAAAESFQRGLYLMSQGLSHLDEAITALETAVSLDPENTEARTRLAALRAQKGSGPARGRERARPWTLAALASGTVVATVWGVQTYSARTQAELPPPTPFPTAVVLAIQEPTPTPVIVPSSTPVPVKTAEKPAGTSTTVAMAKKKTGFLRVAARPWAEVWIDGRKVDTTPLSAPLTLEAGPHTLKLVNPAYKPYVEKIVIKANGTIERSVAFDAARLTLASTPAATVYLDGELLGATPLAAVEIPPGPHTLVLKAEGCDDLSLAILGETGKSLKRSVQLPCR